MIKFQRRKGIKYNITTFDQKYTVHLIFRVHGFSAKLSISRYLVSQLQELYIMFVFNYDIIYYSVL